ncbi:MAG: hypothetical protein ACOZNI_32215 [Myxococcota bacterium]
MDGPSFTMRVRVAVAPRGDEFPREDEALGRAMFARLVKRLERGPVAPAVIVLREDRAQIVDLRPMLARGRDAHRLVAALAGGEGVEAIAVVGIVNRRRRGAPAVERYGGVFVEWSDGRWWAAFRPLDDAMRLVPTDMDDVSRAVDGQARPGGLGGWFSRARFQGLRAEIRVDAPPPPPAEVVN